MLFDAVGVSHFLQCQLITFGQGTLRSPSPFKVFAACLVLKPKSCGFCSSASLLPACHRGAGGTAGALLWMAVPLLAVSGWDELMAGATGETARVLGCSHASSAREGGTQAGVQGVAQPWGEGPRCPPGRSCPSFVYRTASLSLRWDLLLKTQV